MAHLTSPQVPPTLPGTMDTEDLRTAVELALAGDWDRAHRIVQQDEDDPVACRLHAVLHRIESDHGNARYWYGRARRAPPAGQTPEDELREILSGLS